MSQQDEAAFFVRSFGCALFICGTKLTKKEFVEMKKNKGFLSMVLCLAMLISTLPISAFANGSLETVAASGECGDNLIAYHSVLEATVENYTATDGIREKLLLDTTDLIVGNIDTFSASTVQAESASFITRSDGVWFWPTTSYAVSDWAGCNASPSVNSYCYFCGIQHGTCGANHLTTLGHNGIDIPVWVGSKVYAAASGTLYCTNYDWPYRGITAVVEHPITGTSWSYYSIYQHLQSTVTNKNGLAVAAGEVIAYSGNTDGYGTGQAHLHFGILMGVSGQGNALAQAPNANISAIENCGWITAGGYATGRILPNPALNSPAGNPTYTDGCESNVRRHAGSVMYTRNTSDVSIGEKPTECSHNYTFTDTPANCTQNGLREYTCSSCGDTYSEPIEALGHNYIGFKTDATCDTAGYTTYTCTRCSDSYVKVADGWSEWSAEYPADVPENLIEQKTQYSALEKEYTTSTSDTLDGWTNIGTTLSDWGAVQTTTTKPTETDTLRITNTTQTGWGYYHWCSYYNWTYCIDSIQVNGATQVEWHGYTSSFELPAYTIADQGGQQSYGGNGNGAAACPRNFYVWFRNYDADVYTYSYQTREKLNQFYRWSNEWSDWSDTEIQSSEDLQVKTQTVYRYYTGKLADHKYSYTVTEEPSITAEGLLVGTCSVCGATTTMSLPKLNTADYTYAVKTDATCTADGIATYTWKTTTYGNFSFNVTLSKIAHSYDKGQVTVTATCTQNGIKTYTCSDCGDVYTENIAPIGHQYQYGVCITCGVEDPNVTALSGTITSFGSSSEPVTMGIYAKNADTALRTLTVKNGSFMIMGLPVGEYVLSFSKQNHVTREYTVTLEGGETVVDAKICLIGDVTGDGEVNMGDISRLYAHIRNTTPLVDEYQLLCANVNGDDSVNMGDISAIYSHVKGTKKLY